MDRQAIFESVEEKKPEDEETYKTEQDLSQKSGMSYVSNFGKQYSSRSGENKSSKESKNVVEQPQIIGVQVIDDQVSAKMSSDLSRE